MKGIAGVYVGPSDLGFSYGLHPTLDRTEPEIIKIYERIVKECERRGLFPGFIAVDTREQRSPSSAASSWSRCSTTAAFWPCPRTIGEIRKNSGGKA